MTAFWETTALADMTPDQWESLCDGCGRCCLHKLEDIDSGDVYYTAVHCRYLDSHSCRCTVYPQRLKKVPDCVTLSPRLLSNIQWLPESCAYRRLKEGRGLASWHPLLSGHVESVHEAGLSLRDGFINEDQVSPDELEDYILVWVD